MSVLRDAKELGYGLDHFMVTGENFPSEWQDDQNTESNHDDLSRYFDRHNKRVTHRVEIIDGHKHLIETDGNEHINDFHHEYVREYNHLDDYIKDKIDDHYAYNTHHYRLRNNATKKTINVKDRAVINRILDITEYIKNIDITEARRQGITIKSIRCPTHPIESRKTLDANLRKWVRNKRVVLAEQGWSDTPRYKGPFNGQLNIVTFVQIFSNFMKIEKTTTKSLGSGVPTYLMFRELVNDEIRKKHKHYNPEGTPTMLQIAFGLIKKYPEIKIEIRGYIPGINEPMYVCEKWELATAKR